MSPSFEHRLVVVTNPASTQYQHVESDVIERLKDGGFLHVEFETPKVHRQDNIDILREIIEPGDKIIVAGGDGTGNIAVNAALSSDKDQVRVGFLAYGNFNDMASTFTGRRYYKDPLSLAKSEESINAYALRIDVDGRYDRHAMLYASLGWSAQASAAFNTTESRQRLQSSKSTMFENFLKIAKIYSSTKDSASLAEFRLGNDPTSYRDSTDILVTNGPIAAKMIRSGQPYYEDGEFLRTVLDATKLHHNIPFISRSLINLITSSRLRLPGSVVTSETISFDNATVGVQADGEYHHHQDVRQIVISKDDSPLMIVVPNAKPK